MGKESEKSVGAIKKCPTFSAAFLKTVSYAFRLPGPMVLNTPQLISAALEDPKVKKELAAALAAEGKKLMEEQAAGTSLSFRSSAGRLGAAAAGTKASSALSSQIKKSREYQRLETGLRELQCAFDQTPVGVFVDDNKTFLIVVGVVAAIGGGVAMYYTKAGDTGAKAASLISLMKPIEIGVFSIQANKLDFKPSEQKVAVDLGAKAKWSAVEAKFEAKATFTKGDLVAGGGSGSLLYTIDPATSLTSKVGGEWAAGKGDERDRIGASAEVGLKRKLSKRSTLSFRIYGQYASDSKGQSLRTGGRADYKLDKPFGPGSALSLGSSLESKRQQALTGPAKTDERLMFHLKLEY